jgi:hypothetical protein
MAEAVMLANVGTQAAFNLSAWDFVTDGWTTATAGRAYGPGQLSLHELVYGNYFQPAITTTTASGTQTTYGSTSLATGTTGSIVMSNLQNNWLPAVVQSIAIPAGFKIGRRLLRKPITQGNKLLKAAGLRSMVKI